MALTLRSQTKNTQHVAAGGFALPTILIASIVMLTVLLVSVTSTTTLRTAINNQYYSQIAQLAGEAGTAYAEACLHNNGNVPTWSDAKPLTPATDCSGNVQSGYPTYVLTNATNVRSGFSIGMPIVDANGRATTVPNTGYVEITRESNGAVWRRYNQPAVQSAVVPDQCSGTANATLGWNTPAVNTTGAAFPEASSQQISIAPGAINVGPVYLRKDFSVTTPGTYNINNQGDDQSDLYIDGQLVSSVGWATVDTQQVTLGVGCHTIVAKLTNKGILPNAAGLKVAVTRVGASVPTVVTDTSWRVTAGPSRNFSEVNYYADPNWWPVAKDMGGATGNSGWTPATGDSTTRSITNANSLDASNNAPSYSYTLFRDSRVLTVTSPTTVKIAYGCDDNCSIWLDGNKILNNGTGNVETTTLTLPEGSHRFGVDLYNVTGPSTFIFAVLRTGDNAILTSSDSTWTAATMWSTSDFAGSAYSYDNTFFPTPDPRTVNTLIVAGGGSGGGSTGGGGGGGGVISTMTDVNPGNYSVVVGAGAAAPGNQKQGLNGGNSSFNGLTAIGGGGGAASASVSGTSTSYVALSGGSGGGSQDYYGANIGGLGTTLQGNPGGALGYYSASGGGGAGGAGWATESNVGGVGGIGMASAISGTTKYYGGGGGGGNGGAGGLGGGGNGADVGAAGTPNTGGGGGGGWSYATGNGGAGGSGVVIISFPVGKVTATGGTVTTSGGYEIHTFTSSGTFTVTAVSG